MGASGDSLTFTFLTYIHGNLITNALTLVQPECKDFDFLPTLTVIDFFGYVGTIALLLYQIFAARSDSKSRLCRPF